MTKLCIVIVMVNCLLVSVAFCGEVLRTNQDQPKNLLLEEKRIVCIVADITAKKTLSTDYPFGYMVEVPRSRNDSEQNGWIKRHPVIFGTLVGFGSGFAIGLAGGDDGILYDMSGWGTGVILGGFGAGIGAIIGKIASD